MRRLNLLLYLLFVTLFSLGLYRLTDNLELTLMVGVDMFVALAVLSFAFVQISLNRKLIQLQDYVALSMVPDPNTPRSVRFYNTGKLNMYIHRIEVRDSQTDKLIVSTDVFKNPRLVPAGTLEQSYYWYPIPKEAPEDKEAMIVILLSDEFDRKWLSSNGVLINTESKTLSVWSHKTHQKSWKIYKGEEPKTEVGVVLEEEKKE